MRVLHKNHQAVTAAKSSDVRNNPLIEELRYLTNIGLEEKEAEKVFTEKLPEIKFAAKSGSNNYTICEIESKTSLLNDKEVTIKRKFESEGLTVKKIARLKPELEGVLMTDMNPDSEIKEECDMDACVSNSDYVYSLVVSW